MCVFCPQKEEGLIQGQLNHSDSKQYITELRQQIAELKNEVRFHKPTNTYVHEYASSAAISHNLCTCIVICDQKKSPLLLIKPTLFI